MSFVRNLSGIYEVFQKKLIDFRWVFRQNKAFLGAHENPKRCKQRLKLSNHRFYAWKTNTIPFYCFHHHVLLKIFLSTKFCADAPKGFAQKVRSARLGSVDLALHKRSADPIKPDKCKNRQFEPKNDTSASLAKPNRWSKTSWTI